LIKLKPYAPSISYRDLVGKPEGKRILGRPRRRWEDNINKKFWEELIAYFP
jgi:hypothetical protein